MRADTFSVPSIGGVVMHTGRGGWTWDQYASGSPSQAALEPPCTPTLKPRWTLRLHPVPTCGSAFSSGLLAVLIHEDEVSKSRVEGAEAGSRVQTTMDKTETAFQKMTLVTNPNLH